MSEQGSYLYAVARPLPADRLAHVTGIGGAPVRCVSDGELSCVLSTVDLADFGTEALRRNLEQLDWLERVAREHDAVVHGVCRVATALPLRLATVYRDDASATAEVARRRTAVLRMLDRVEGRDEWGVKMYRVPAAEPAAAAARPSSGAEYLRRRRAQLQRHASDEERARDDASAVFEELALVAVESRRHRPQDPQLAGNRHPMLLNAAFLVDRSAASAFQAAVDRLAAAHPPGAVVRTGPWPPYSFVDWGEP